MPKNKDLKRRVRARMTKTGESYTAARAQILGTAPPPLPDDYESLAGQTDDTVRTRTGRTWPEWARVLDEIGATEMDHPDIAKWVHAQIDDFWWAQTVSIGYERIRGLRAIGQGRDGAFEASKSKTLRASRARAHATFLELATESDWLGELSLSGATEPKSVRFVDADGGRATVWLAEKGPEKCTASVSHKGIPTEAKKDAHKVDWGERLAVIAERLSRRPQN